MTPAEIKAIRERLGMTSSEFGEALGFSDPARVVRALETGTRKGKPFPLSGPAAKALEYLLAIHRAAHACNDTQMLEHLAPVLPERLKP